MTGMKYTGAGGEKIENQGEGQIKAKSEEGTEEEGHKATHRYI